MSSEKPNTAEAKPTPVPQSTIFCADADVIIRTAGSRDLHAHKLILSLVSPIFKDMFTVPQPPTDTPDTLPHVDVEESAETWDYILKTIYPVPHPIVDNLDDLESLLLAAMKYEMQSIVDVHKESLENREFVRDDPLRLYAIVCACGLEDQAKYVARNAELLTVTRRSDAADLRGLTVDPYHNLVSFLAQRDEDWRQDLAKVQTPNSRDCSCHKPHVEVLYSKIKKNLGVAYLSTEEIYLKALEDRAVYRQMWCASANCSVADPKIKVWIEGGVKRRERLCDRFVPGTLVPAPYPRVPHRKLDSVVPWDHIGSHYLTLAFCSCIALFFIGKRARSFF